MFPIATSVLMPEDRLKPSSAVLRHVIALRFFSSGKVIGGRPTAGGTEGRTSTASAPPRILGTTALRRSAASPPTLVLVSHAAVLRAVDVSIFMSTTATGRVH